MAAMKPFLPDCVRFGHPWWLVVALFMLVSVITAGCSPSSAPPATRILTPTYPPPLEGTTLTADRKTITSVILTPTYPPPLEGTTPTTDTETVTIVILTPTSPPPLESTTPTTDTETVTTVSGYVIDGGDTTPEGLADAPRKFVYKIQKEDGFPVYVTYTAYPPSPFRDSQRNRIGLDFHAGTILIGDYLEARGSYDRDTNTLIVAVEGDYIETYPEKP